jgi:hypothetical protein
LPGFGNARSDDAVLREVNQNLTLHAACLLDRTPEHRLDPGETVREVAIPKGL